MPRTWQYGKKIMFDSVPGLNPELEVAQKAIVEVYVSMTEDEQRGVTKLADVLLTQRSMAHGYRKLLSPKPETGGLFSRITMGKAKAEPVQQTKRVKAAQPRSGKAHIVSNEEAALGKILAKLDSMEGRIASLEE